MEKLNIDTTNSIITDEEVRFIIKMGSTIPSGDNCQPFFFEFKNGILSIFHSKKRAWHAFDNQKHASIIAFGCLIKAIEIAASASQLKIHKTFYDPLLEDLWCDITFSREKLDTHPHVEFLSSRLTDRRPFSTTPLTIELKEKLEAMALKYEDIKFSYIEKIPDNLMSFLLASEGYMWKTPKGLIDFLKWIRFSKKEILKHYDGMPVLGLGINKIDALFLRLLRTFPSLVNIFWPLALRRIVQKNAEKLLKSSGGILLFSVKTKHLKNLINIGSCAQEIWVELNSQNYGVQPWTLPALNVYDVFSLKEIECMSDEYLNLYQGGLSILQESFSLESDEIPVWMFRTGITDEFPEDMKTRRRPVEEILSVF